MRCPACDADTHDPDDLFCSSCGHSLKPSSSDVTGRLEDGNSVESTAEIGGESSVAVSSSRDGPVALVSDLAAAIRHAIIHRGWLDATSAAAVGFLGLLCVGAVLLVGAKLQFTGLGSGASPLSVLDAIVILSLGCLGVPIDFESLEITVLPLGALLAAGWVISAGARMAVRRAGDADLGRQAIDGAKTGLPFGLLCFLCALMFKLDATHADAGVALILGTVWGALFGAVGGLRASRPLSAVIRLGLSTLRARSRAVYDGVVGGGVMLVTAIALATIASLVWIVAGLASGAPSESFGPGEAGAAVVYLAAFGLNVVVAIITFSLGGTIEVGAQITVGGRVVGPLREFSLLDWGRGDPPWYAFALLMLPVIACLLGGYAARRNAGDAGKVVPILGTAALVFGLALAVLAVLGEARLGAGLVRERGFGRVAPDPLAALFLGGIWAAVVGFLGWRLGSGESRAGPTEPEVFVHPDQETLP
ncbi:MAG: cell division protein PerM [Actinomycetota bacterium]